MPIGIPTPGADLLSSMAGRVGEVAKLVIYDCRALRPEPPEDNAQGQANNNINAIAGAEVALNPPLDGIPLQPQVPVVQPRTMSYVKESLEKNKRVRKLIFEVQFNPSELSLNASALTINKQSLGTNKKGQPKVDKGASSGMMNLNVNLIFDKMNEFDAFIFETGTSGVAGAGTAIATAVSTRKFSVKPEVEALMAALRESHTREAAFCWNDFSFDGTLQFVQVRYTMFSPAGHPIRATVAIRMKREAAPGDTWEQDFETAFSGGGGRVLSRTQNTKVLNM